MGNHLQYLREHGVAQRLVEVDCHAMAVVGRQAEADTDAVNLDAPVRNTFPNTKKPHIMRT